MSSRRIIVVGSGTRFLSGISVYTLRLADALAAAGHRVAIVTMRQLLPTRFYPGRQRVGQPLTQLDGGSKIARFDGVDWHWIPSLFHAARFMARRRPDLLILQWWTGTVLHTYLALALIARWLGAHVIVEFHEVQDTGEVRIRAARLYARLMGRSVLRLASGFAVHSAFDRELLGASFDLRGRPVSVLPHGPHDHYQPPVTEPGDDRSARQAPSGVLDLLFFGVIRPYKGLEDLVAAFDSLEPAEISGYWLTVVGETWEGWTQPAERIKASRYRDRITFVNRYVTDQELHGYLSGADAVVLPYRRSSLSGPLHVAMGYGLPIVMTDVGGNAEAAEGYGGIKLVPVADPAAIAQAVRGIAAMTGTRFAHPHSWAHTADAYDALFDRVAPVAARQPAAPIR